MTASVSTLHHYTIGCAPDELPELVDFYTRCVGLKVGFRPPLSRPGRWLYSGERAIVHLLVVREERAPAGTGPVDHISFRAHGLASTKQFLHSEGIDYTEKPLAGTSLHQMFLHDPGGLQVELTFDLDDD